MTTCSTSTSITTTSAAAATTTGPKSVPHDTNITVTTAETEDHYHQNNNSSSEEDSSTNSVTISRKDNDNWKSNSTTNLLFKEQKKKTSSSEPATPSVKSPTQSHTSQYEDDTMTISIVVPQIGINCSPANSTHLSSETLPPNSPAKHEQNGNEMKKKVRLLQPHINDNSLLKVGRMSRSASMIQFDRKKLKSNQSDECFKVDDGDDDDDLDNAANFLQVGGGRAGRSGSAIQRSPSTFGELGAQTAQCM